MAGNFGGQDDEVISGINVTPLVDVVLVLLVIFLMTAPVIYQSAIKVDLPKASSGEEAKSSPLSFSLNEAGELFWSNDKVNPEEVTKRLKDMGDKINDQTAIISADIKTPHGKVVELMDTLRNAGLFKFALNVDRK